MPRLSVAPVECHLERRRTVPMLMGRVLLATLPTTVVSSRVPRINASTQDAAYQVKAAPCVLLSTCVHSSLVIPGGGRLHMVIPLRMTAKRVSVLSADYAVSF